MNLFKKLRNWAFRSNDLTLEQAILAGYLNSPFGSVTHAGITITPQAALSITGIWRGIDLISGQMAAMELTVLKRGRNGSTPDRNHRAYDLLAYQPNDEMNSHQMRRMIVMDLLLHGNAYLPMSRDGEGELLEIVRADPKCVEIYTTQRGLVKYRINGRSYSSEDVIHIKSLSTDGIVGISPIFAARESLALTKATELYGSSFFGNGATPSGFLKSDKKLNPEAKKDLLDIINRDHGGVGKAHKLEILPPGVDWILNSVTPENAQFLLTRTFQLSETARILNLDGSDLGDYSQGRPSTVEEANLQLYTRCLMPWCETIEAELNSKLFGREERRTWFVKHNMTSLLRGNSNARADYFGKMFNLGAVDTNRIIMEENLGETIGEAGDQHFIPENNLTSLEQIHQNLKQSTVEPVVDVPVADQAEPASTDAPENVAASAMNGSQTASLMAIVGQLSQGLIPSATAKALIKAAFPSLDEATIDGIISPLATFKPVTATDPTVTSAAGDPVAAVRSVVADSVQRMVKREAEAVRRAANKPDTFSSTVEGFYAKHQAIVTEAVGPSVRAFCVVAQTSEDPDQLTQAIADQLVSESRSALANLDNTSATFADQVNTICDDWLTNRANSVAEVL